MTKARSAKEGPATRTWRQVSEWDSGSQRSDGLRPPWVCSFRVFIKHIDRYRCPYEGRMKSLGLIAIYYFENGVGGDCIFSVLCFLYMLETFKFICKISIDNDIVTGSFLCSLNFTVCISERKILHIADLVSTIFSHCRRIDFLLDLFIWAPIYA